MKDIAKKIILGVIILEIIIIIISAIIIINNKFNKAETNNEENTENVDSENFIIAEHKQSQYHYRQHRRHFHIGSAHG